MSYLSYMTCHYKHVRNDNANAIKATKYIEHQKNKKSFIKSVTHKMICRVCIIENICSFDHTNHQPKQHNSFVCIQAHSNQRDFAPFRKLILKPSVIQLLAALLEGTGCCFVN